MSASLTEASQAAYTRAWVHFKNFLAETSLSLTFPVPVDHLVAYISYLFDQNYAASTITSFVSAISFVHKITDYPDPGEKPLIKKLLLGCRKLKATSDGRLPISIDILLDILRASSITISAVFARKRFQAMCALAFHALLRVGEMTASKNNLSIGCILLEKDAVSINFATYKHSAGSRAILRINAKSTNDCPVLALREYLALRGRSSGPLFITTSGEEVPRQVFTAELKSALEFAGVQSNRFTSHSFRIGGATHMAINGASDAQIRQAGRWASNAFLSYIRIGH